MKPDPLACLSNRGKHSSTGVKLPLHLKQMGVAEACGHRSGWRFVMDHLRTANCPDGMLLDDFVERSFQHAYQRQRWDEPWVGIFHHPPNLPPWLDPSAPPRAILRTEEFVASRTHLKGAVALSRYLGDWLGQMLGCPVLVVKHPTEVPSRTFSLDAWRDAPYRQIVQVGWYARNPRAIYQVPLSANVRKIHLMQDRPWVAEARERTDRLSPLRNRESHGTVEVVYELDNDGYDSLLATSLVFNEYVDVSASNTVIEAIARSTPIIVNRHPALEEYLGEEYPLFYTELAEVDNMIADVNRVAAAFQYLTSMDKSWLCGAGFTKKVVRFVEEVG